MPVADERRIAAAGIERLLRSRFCKSAAFTTMQRLQLMEKFRTLEGVEARGALLEGAAEARTQAEALGSIREGKMLIDLHARTPIRSLEFVGLPLAVLNDGTHAVLCPYDYVTNTPELTDGVNAYRASNPGVTTVFVTADRVSSAARKTFESADITVIEGGPSNW